MLTDESNLSRTLIDSLPDDTEGRFVAGNAAYIRFLGLQDKMRSSGRRISTFFRRSWPYGTTLTSRRASGRANRWSTGRSLL